MGTRFLGNEHTCDHCGVKLIFDHDPAPPLHWAKIQVGPFGQEPGARYTKMVCEQCYGGVIQALKAFGLADY